MSDSQKFWEYAGKVLNDQRLIMMTMFMSSDEDRMKAVKSIFNWTPSTLNSNSGFKKSSAKSIKYAEAAIKAANSGQKEKSMKLANMITAFGQDAGDLALGHMIRAQLLDLYKMDLNRKIEEVDFCIKSPQPAKQINVNIKLKKNSHGNGKKLSKKDVLLRLLCPSLLLKDLRAERESSHNKKVYEDLEKQQEIKKQFTRELFTLKSPNPKAPSLADFVEIKYNSVKGRHLIVTKDVPAGTTLVIEKPFVSGLVTIFELEISHCHNCYKEEFIPIPCPNCVFVLYCSEKCVELSKKFHCQYECLAFPHLNSILSSLSEQPKCLYLSALSMVCTFGPHELFRAFKKEQQQKSPRKKEKEPSTFVIPGVDPETGIYDPNSIHTISHTYNLKGVCSKQDVVIALALIKILETRTPFFQQLEMEPSFIKNVKTQFQDFLTLFLIKMANSFIKHESKELQLYDDPDYTSSSYAVSIVPTLKLTNHSCDHNLLTIETRNVKGLGIAEVAMRDLKKGEELTRNYHVHDYSDEPKPSRQQTLFAMFEFKCECVACHNDWPLAEQMILEGIHPKFCCPLCSKKTPPQPEMMTKAHFQKIAINSGNNFICSQCKSKYKKKELMTQFKRHSTVLEVTEQLIEKGSSVETLKSLKAASTFFQNYLVPPSYHRAQCQYLISAAIGKSLVDVFD